MALIFNDTLQATDCTGLYTLMAFINGTWVDIHSIPGPQSGATPVDAGINRIPVDTSLLVTGQTYDFKWVDTIGNESNVVSLTVPRELAITAYGAGEAAIDFVNTGGDAYSITWHIAPIAYESMSGATVVSYDYMLVQWVAGNRTQIQNSNATTDYTTSVSGLGAGVYQMNGQYHLSDGTGFIMSRITKTDANGNIIADIQSVGVTVVSVSGLTITATADFIQTGCDYPIRWIALNTTEDRVTPLGTGTSITATLPTDTLLVIAMPEIDALFSADDNGDVPAAQAAVVTIS